MNGERGMCPMSYRETTDKDPYDFYDALLGQGPVVWDAGLQAWLVTSYAACRDVMRDDDTRFVMPERKDKDAFAALQGGARVLTLLEGEAHLRMHRWWLDKFGPAPIAAWSERFILPIVDARIDTFIGDGHAELASGFGDIIPVTVIAALLGLPWQDKNFLREMKATFDEVLALFGQRMGLGGGADQEKHAAVTALATAASARANDLMRPYVLARRDGKGDDLISLLWRDGPALLPDFGVEDVIANIRLIFQGGVDTTAHAIKNAIMLMLTQPGLFARLKTATAAQRGVFVEEVLRLHGPVHFRSREAIVDAEIAGQTIAAGEAVIPVIAAANRDPAQYASPVDIDLDRSAARIHLAFHYGKRVCIGAPLARAELQVAVARLVDRLDDLRLDPAAAPPEFKGWLLRSYRPLNVLFGAAADLQPVSGFFPGGVCSSQTVPIRIRQAQRSRT